MKRLLNKPFSAKLKLITGHVTLATLLLTGACSHSNTGDRENLIAGLDSLLEANYSDDAPGCALLIAENGKIIYDRGIGIADLSTGEKIDGNTAFNIASCSKQFTAVGFLRLHEQGTVGLDDTIATYFPEYHGEMWKQVTFRHLLSQCSGVPDARPRDNRDLMIHANDSVSMAYFSDLDTLKFKPGSAYDYINPTFLLVSTVIERLTGMDFEQYQQDSVFAPAGMSDVRYFAPERVIPHMAHGYVTDDTGHWTECDYGEETFFATRADGGIYTSTHELFNWEMALRDNRVITSQSRDMAYSPHITVTGSTWSDYQNRPHTHYGLGWFIDDTPGQETKVYHTGDNGGFQAYIAKWDNSRVVVIMLENRNDHDRWQMQLEIERLLRQNKILH